EYAVECVSCSHFDVTLKLLQKFLPKESPDELTFILDMRSSLGVDSYSELLESQEVRDAFGETELKHLDEHLELQRKPARQAFSESLKSYREREGKRAVKRLCAQDKGGVGGQKLISNGLRLYPAVVRAQKLSESEALSFLPPGSTAKKRSIDNRWDLKWSCNKRTRTWTRHGELEAFALCAGFLWACFHEAGGQACPHDWIKEIYQKEKSSG
ncbi:unnamed protein product, partial [Symbiodinium necroappetens]